MTIEPRANNQCPNCGHRFSDREMLFWGFSRTSRCPGCDVELGVDSNRMLILWCVGIIAVLAVESTWSFESVQGWVAIGIFVVLFGLVAVRMQKLVIKR